MTKTYICNAFSLSMLDRETQSRTEARYPSPRYPVPVEDPRKFLKDCELWTHHEVVSAVGHADVATLFSAQLGVEVPVNRVSVKLLQGDIALVGQYIGPRLPEGATALPEGAKIEWWVV